MCFGVLHRAAPTPTKHFIHRFGPSGWLTGSSIRAFPSQASHDEQRRYAHPHHKAPSTAHDPCGHPSNDTTPDLHGHVGLPYAPLSILPLGMVLRSLVTSAVSSSPLLPPSLRILSALVYSTNPLLSLNRNPLIRYLLRKSLYKQFCAGENADEVRTRVAQLKGIGFTGVILAYAKEAPTDAPIDTLEGKGEAEGEEPPSTISHAVVPWAEGTLETVRMAAPGDFVALKFTGAGNLAVYQLSNRLPPSPRLSQLIDDICQLASERGVRLLFDGEQHKLQDGIDAWTLKFARKYNTTPGCATVFGTYQAYKRSMPDALSRHLAEAQKGGFTLGIKLVRGAYLGSDLRHLFYGSKADTDACYDSSAVSVLTRQWNSTLKGAGQFPNVSVMLATHNTRSVQRAYTICKAGNVKSEVFFAQLQGMADQISCELVEANQVAFNYGTSAGTAPLKVYKYMAWGKMGDCMKYLLRRAEENRDAVTRTRNDRDAARTEILRRIKTVFSGS